jgi:hypothetical protein
MRRSSLQTQAFIVACTVVFGGCATSLTAPERTPDFPASPAPEPSAQIARASESSRPSPKMVTPIPVPPPRERGQDAAERKLSHSRSAPHPKPRVARAPSADAKPSRRIDPAPDELSPERNLHFNDTAQFGFDKAERVSAYLTADMEQAGVEPEKAELWTRCLMFTARTFDLNPLFVYAVTRHESGRFNRRLDAESAGNDFYPVRRDKQGRVVDAGVFGVAQVRYGAHRKLVP